MARVLLDSDILIDHLRGAKRIAVQVGEAAYSSVTRAELYAGRNADEGAINDLLGAFEEIPVTRPIAEEAGRIRRESRLPLPDAIIASTAVLSGRDLFTRNRRHFSSVPGLALHQQRRRG